MKITNKHTGFSFNLSEEQAADFFYCKNAKGEYINKSEDYTIEDENIWIDEVWDKVIEELPIIHSYLCNPSISWLPRINEMYNIPINTILGLLWSFAHIPTEEERLKENQEDNFEYENLDY